MKVENDMQKKSLTALVRHHLNHARDASSGRSAETVYGGHVHVLRQTLIALRAGQRLGEHDNLAEATVQVLEGRVVLTSGGASWSGWRGDLITMPPGRNSLEAVEDTVILLTVAKLIAPARRPELIALCQPTADGTVDGTTAGTETIVLDARSIPHAIRHAAVFGALDAVLPGFTLDVIEPHDPQHMLAELQQSQPDTFDVSYIERGPEFWRVRFSRA
ncbi:DUF2249 domain-containing protein [Cryobacterium ruanii]|uniref:DUF2249 domain-containing protein n=1 Tax=Cryobacterium ruanii TaxID=1259197 RepID=A0A4R9ARK4_9MICO|nr:DUF2249 domain-containing protein [Cryobacterium ruanii]